MTTTSYHFEVEGMSCGACVTHVEEAFRSVGGVESVEVDLAGGAATVVAGDQVDTAAMERAVANAGYEAALRS